MYKNVTALSIDDNEQNLMLLEAYSEQINLKLNSFTQAIDALEFSKKHKVDIVFVDYMMPKMNGLEFIEAFRLENKTAPIVMITASGDDTSLKLKAYELGVNEFLNKPLDMIEFQVRTKNLLKLRKAESLLEERALCLENEVKTATKKLIEREQESLIILGKTAEWKDPETGSHVARVAHYSKLLAKCYGLSKEEQEIIFYASPFHDIGKVGIPDSILLKDGKLNNDEFCKMKNHVIIGHDILKESESKYLKMGAIIALSHHEKYNGTGYPSSLKGKDIPIYGRIVAIADVFDALTSIRPYKEAWSFQKAVEFLQQKKSEDFDPILVDLFIQNLESVKEIYEEFQES